MADSNKDASFGESMYGGWYAESFAFVEDGWSIHANTLKEVKAIATRDGFVLSCRRDN